jgi:UDP-N-acetylglucosamine 2-epimerase (non-hydrolysing)
MSQQFKVTTVLGTRPEIIRLGAVIKKFDSNFEHRFVHTGQNAQLELSSVFYKDLDLRQPDVFLGLETSSLGVFMGGLFPAMEKELTENRPDALVILGDTNSALVAILAKRMRIPVYHLEAGNRSFDLNVPEEINRKIVDHSSDFNLCYTSHAARNLEREGIHPRFVSVIGSPLREVIDLVNPKVETSRILDELGIMPGKYFLASIHRQENIDSDERLGNIVDCLNSLVDEFSQPVIVSAHPRFVHKLSSFEKKLNPSIRMIKPFGFVDFLKLQTLSTLVISDSGSVSEESAIVGFKAVTFRDSMERPEALEAGSIIMTGTSAPEFMQAVRIALASPKSEQIPSDYLIPDTSTRVVNFMTSTISQYGFWNGIRATTK